MCNMMCRVNENLASKIMIVTWTEEKYGQQGMPHFKKRVFVLQPFNTDEGRGNCISENSCLNVVNLNLRTTLWPLPVRTAHQNWLPNKRMFPRFCYHNKWYWVNVTGFKHLPWLWLDRVVSYCVVNRSHKGLLLVGWTPKDLHFALLLTVPLCHRRKQVSQCQGCQRENLTKDQRGCHSWMRKKETIYSQLHARHNFHDLTSLLTNYDVLFT